MNCDLFDFSAIFRNTLIRSLWLLSISQLSACEIKSLDDSGQGAATQAEQHSLSAEIQEGSTFNRFSVKLSLPPGGSVLLRRLSKQQQDWQNLATDQYIDDKVAAGRSYIYQIGSFQERAFVATQEIAVNIPIDIFIRGEQIIKSDEVEIWKNIRNLELMPDSVIITEGQDLIIKASSIKSHGGVIKSFRENQTAIEGTKGRSGGRIDIESQAGEGLLIFHLRGENGGKGLKGSAGANFQAGGPGEAGQDGGDSGEVHLSLPPSLKVEVHHWSGAGGPGGEGGSGGFAGLCRPDQVAVGLKLIFGNWNYHSPESICPRPRSSGSQGAAGRPGTLGKTCELPIDLQQEICTQGER